MSRWNPCKRNEFIRRLRKLGFDGLYSGSKHQFMIYSVPQLKLMLREVGEIVGRPVTNEEWKELV